jgi:tRNA pseudouridine38-40 synthase
MEIRMKLIVAYHGRPFHGWQRQKDRRTIQGELERALGSVTGRKSIAVTGASRTDAGVHAAGQTAHCDLPVAIPPEALIRAVNAKLPLEIKVRSARLSGAGFHARKSARSKLYIYRARWQAPSLPWADPLSAQVTPVTECDIFEEALRILVGRHDWASFTVANPETGSTVRTVSRVSCRWRRSGIDLDFEGDGFLRYQVRRMVGAALEVGRGRRRLEDLRALIEDPQPGAPIQTAPAAGLTLHRVVYRRSARLDPNTGPFSATASGSS